MKNNKNIPPRFAQRLLRSFLRDDLAEEVEGDLDEKFYATLKQKSLLKAKLHYWYEVFHYLRPFAIRKSKTHHLIHYAMYRSYFKIGLRNLQRNMTYSFINIGGLALGMTVAIFNGLWIWDELSFDTYHSNYDRIAQVAVSGMDEGQRWVGTTMTYPLSTELITHHRAHFKHIVRATRDREFILSTETMKMSGSGIYADAGAPEMFTFEMTHGTWSGLQNTHSILISSSLAQALFGSNDPLNAVLRINNKTDVTVGGVYKDFPLNTSFYGVKFVASWELYLLDNPWIEQRAINDWRNHFIQVYVEILPSTNFEKVTGHIKNSVKADPADAEKFAKEKREALLLPMDRWHLYPPNYNGAGTDPGPIRMLWLVGSIGAFVLLLACINFMNLSTARSEKRAKEVGIRKTIGSLRKQLIQQFFSESFLIVFFAFFLSLLTAALALPAFNSLADKQIVMPWTVSGFWLLSLGFVFITGLLAGSYPAFYLSAFSPVKVLKGTYRVGRFASMPRKVLVVVQFSISVILIISTVVVFQQIQFAKNRPVGYTREGLIMIEKKSSDFKGKYDVLRNELRNTGAVEEMSESMGKMTEVMSGNDGWDWKGRTTQEESFGTLSVTHEHGKTVGWQFVAGRDFSREFASDSSGLVINEAAARYMGLENPVGELVSWTWWTNQKVKNYKILGVVKDMVMDSPYDPIEPTLFYVDGFNGSPNCINIRINPNLSTAEALLKIESVFKKVIPTVPFDYKFVDEEYSLKFAQEERIGKLASVFASLAILISCLGLFGLASFVAEQRTKEIGIRKVLGASVLNLWRMLSKDFVGLVIIACFIAIPFAFYFLNGWLQHYTYRTEISGWVFVSTTVIAVLITILTVSYQAIKAALMNPVNSLRSE